MSEPGAPADVRQSNLMASKAQSRLVMSHMSAAVAQRLAYKEMKSVYYYGCTIGMYALCLVGALTIPNITLIFDLVSGIAISCIAFFVPATLYLMLEERYQRGILREEEVKKQKMYRALSWFYLFLGLFNFTAGMISTINGIVSGEE